MKKLFLLILFGCLAFVLNVQANNGHNKFIFYKKHFSRAININDSIPKDTADAKPVFNVGNIDPKTYIGDPFFSARGKIKTSDGATVINWKSEPGEKYPSIYFENPKNPDEQQDALYLGYSLSKDSSGGYARRDDGKIFQYNGSIVKEVKSAPKVLYNARMKDIYRAENSNSTPNQNLSTNFNNSPAGTKSATEVLGTATIIDSSNVGMFLKITRSNNITLVNVIKLDKYPNANVYLSTKLIKIANLPQPTYGLYNIGQNGAYTVSPVPTNLVPAYAKYSSSPWTGTSN